jgi:hypothetical protein
VYCPSCGVAVAQGLTYCNYCGGKLNRDSGDRPPDIRPGGLVTMMVATFVMGTFVITLLMGMLKAVLHFEYGPILAIALLSFLIMIGLESIFTVLLFRRTRHDYEPRETRQNNRANTKELEAESRLPIEPIPSVTEQTTRPFEPIYNKRK